MSEPDSHRPGRILTQQGDGIRLVGSEEMPWQEFAAIPDHPHQRNTVEHAKKAGVIRALGDYSDAHRAVATVTVGGRTYKADGHTRVYYWQSGLTKSLPENLVLHVTRYLGADMEAATRLYHTFDSVSAVEAVSDKLYGGARALGLDFKSELLRGNNYAYALKFMAEMLGLRPGRDRDASYLDSLLRYFTDELLLLDSCRPVKKKWAAGFTIASLILFMRYGEQATEFFMDYMAGRGNKLDGEEDRVESLISLHTYLKNNEMLGARHLRDVVGRAILCYERTPGKLYAKGVRPMTQSSLKSFIDEAIAAKETRTGPFKWVIN